MKIESVYDDGDCMVTVEFNNPNGGNTTLMAVHENFETTGSSVIFDQVAPHETTYTFFNFAPGETYYIYLMNEMDASTADVFSYTVCETRDYDFTNLRLYDVNLCYFRLDSVQGDYGYNYANDLSARKIQSMLDEQTFLLKVDFRHNVYSQDIEKIAMAVVKSPTGHVSSNATMLTIYKHCDGFWQTMKYMNGALEEMIQSNGSIPTCRYEVEIYVDGMLLGNDHFTIN